MILTEKRLVSELPTENRNCLSLPTKEGVFEKVPTEQCKRLGDTHVWNKAFFWTDFFWRGIGTHAISPRVELMKAPITSIDESI